MINITIEDINTMDNNTIKQHLINIVESNNKLQKRRREIQKIYRNSNKGGIAGRKAQMKRYDKIRKKEKKLVRLGIASRTTP